MVGEKAERAERYFVIEMLTVTIMPPESLGLLKTYSDSIDSEEEKEVFHAAMEATREWESSPGYYIGNCILTLMNAINHICHRNYTELIHLIARCETTEEIYWKQVNESSKEFMRLLSNYIGSMKNAENYTERIVSELDEYCSSDPLISELYDVKVKKCNLDLYEPFFTSLRNYIVHHEPIDFTIHMSEEERYSFALDKEYVLSSNEWSTRAKGYVDSWENNVIISEAIVDYDNAIDELYNWLVDHVSYRFLEEGEEMERLAENAEKLQTEFFDKADVEMMSFVWEEGP
ncbi:hypothetical protein [Natronolimnobius baerhuensis]|uniref:hypothetical protein n=1 Tax=Natronolimnobius baerhuensis TaxID=253108 RepID=UPI000B400295|nr:hypothetical protein [Natronolimnobius baerhuensis]